MDTKTVLKSLLSKDSFARLKRFVRKRQLKQVRALTPLSSTEFRGILRDDLGICKADVLFIHSSFDLLNVALPVHEVLKVLQEAVGKEGTLLFPTYPTDSSLDFVAQGGIFNIRTTISRSGLLTECARRHSAAIRSLHPTKSVCCLGPLAKELTNSHHKSPYPYDACSPYYMIMGYGGKLIGLGVSTVNLAFFHTVDDAMKGEFPIKPYHETLFRTRCINYSGIPEVVDTYAHDPKKMFYDPPRLMRKHIPHDVGQDIAIKGRQFFRADSKALFESLLALARQGITIYSRRVYEK